MALVRGQSLSFYEILEPLGAGGMGEVWRARDTRLEREVAIKVLPEVFADDEERLRRFEREARALASLNHPNVAQIYGIDQIEHTCFLALELVPGQDLATRLARGPLPLEEALDVCRQIAEGLAAAHDAGVVHRDLKPANVCVTPEGVVKLLDFGLAKPTREARSGGRVSTPPKPDSFLMTEAGLVLGTPTYMSPEQARGRPVDRQTDVWSFGCVLYECLTGARAFAGETLADVLAAIVEREPDLARLSPQTPRRVVELLRRTLVKDPRQRLQHLGDARVELELALREPAAQARADERGDRRSGAPGRRAAPVAALLGGLVLGAAGAWLALSGRDGSGAHLDSPSSATRLAIPIPRTSQRLHPRLAPDGRSVVFAGQEDDPLGGTRRVLFLRRLDAAEAVRLPGTEHATTLAFAPDGGSLAVVVSGSQDPGDMRVVRVILDQGSPSAVPSGPFVPDPNASSGIAWTDSGLLVASGNRSRLHVRAVEGGSWRELAIEGPAAPDSYAVYHALPGGRHVLAHSFTYASEGFEPALVAIDVETGAVRELLAGGHAKWIPTGHLLFTRGDTLFAVGFEPQELRVVGTPWPLFDGLRTQESWRPAWFDVAANGTLIHEPGGRQGDRRSLATVGPDGTLEPWSPERRAFDGWLRVSPGGGFFTVGVVNSSGLVEVWGSEVESPLLRPLLAAPGCDFLPGPIDDSGGLLYYAVRSEDERDGIWRAPLDALERGEPVWVPTELGPYPYPVELMPDGRTLLALSSGERGGVLSEVRLREDGAWEVQELSELPEAWRVRLSPDGRWLAYSAPLDGQHTLLLRRRRADGSLGPVFPVPHGSREPVDWVHWSRRAGAEHPSLLYGLGDGSRILELDMLGDDPPRFSAPRLRASLGERGMIDVDNLPDGRLFVLLREEGEQGFDRIEVVLDAFALLPD